MTPYFSDGQVTLLQGHVLDCLRALPSESVQCVITSPPYWALRSYGTAPQVWGGDPEHSHVWAERNVKGMTGGSAKVTLNGGNEWQDSTMFRGGTVGDCPCGAWRGELGHEPTPQMFVAHLVEVFREVRRVLKSDGVCFCNIGDSYSGSGKGPTGHNGIGDQEDRQGFTTDKSRTNRGSLKTNLLGGKVPDGLKPKDLVLIPERFALAMQDDGWFVRSRIAWCKRAPMPESVRDRPTNAWEHIWMFTKSARYFWDADAVREDGAGSEWAVRTPSGWDTGEGGHGAYHRNGRETSTPTGEVRNPGRNMWSYWLLSPDPEPMAHFATFPREVPRRCIAAATSDRGECPKCGTPWVRTSEKERNGTAWINPKGAATQTGGKGTERLGPGIADRVLTTGWAPQCAHDLPPVPQTVLDPFVGSGTTTQVARSMLRRSIGIDLNETYLHDIALRKNAQMSLMIPPDTEAS